MTNQQPYTYRILSRCRGSLVTKGEPVLCKTDCRIIYAWPGFPDYFAEIIDNEFNGEIVDKDQVRVVIDHMCPPRDQKQCDYLNLVRDWCDRQKLACSNMEGIGHYLAIEQGWVKPGELVAHFDAHVASVGAVGALGIGSAIEMLIPLVTGKIWLSVPPLYRVDLRGKLPPGVMGRDLIHYLVEQLGTVSYSGAVLEFYCDGDSGMTLDDKMVICNLINYLGAMSALFVPEGEAKGTENFYEGVIPIDLSALEPYLCCPPATNYPEPLRAHVGKKVDMAIIGTCSGGGINDIAAAAKILHGKKIKKGVQLYVCPSTNQVFTDAVANGYISGLIAAGAFISSPTCDFCYGRAVYLPKGCRAISTQTLNIPGRLGSLETEIFLASPAAVAASALHGEITDPRGICGQGGVV